MTSPADIRRQEQMLADEVMALKREMDKEKLLPYLEGDSFKKCTWRDLTRNVDAVTKKVSAWGNMGINDVFDVQDLGNGQTYEQYVMAGDNLDLKYTPTPANAIDLLMMDEDSKNPRLRDAAGNNVTFNTALHEFGKIIKAAAKFPNPEDVHMDIEDMPGRMVQYVVQFSFVEFDDLNDADAHVVKRTEVRSYMSGSGADCAWLHFGGWGINGGILDGGYGERTKIAPTAVVDGVEHQFGLKVSPMCTKDGKAYNIVNRGTEKKDDAAAALAKGLSIEMPIGPHGCKKLTSTLTAIFAIEKMPRPTPPPVPKPAKVFHDVVYLTVDPVSKMAIYSRKHIMTNAFHRWTIDHCQSAVTLGAPFHTQIIGYTPAAMHVFAPAAVPVVTAGVAGVVLGESAPAWRFGYRGVQPMQRPQHYRSLRRPASAPLTNPSPCPSVPSAVSNPAAQPVYRSASALFAPPATAAAPPVDDEEPEEQEEEIPAYRSLGESSGSAAVAIASAEAEEAPAPAADDDDLVIVESGDAAADTSSDAAIAAVLEEEPPVPVPPAVGDKRSLSTSDRDTPFETTLALTRQSRTTKSTGKAKEIKYAPKVSGAGVPIVTHTITMAKKRGVPLTRADLLELNKIKGELIELAKKNGGVKSEKKLSDTYSMAAGITSNGPLSLQAKCDIQATKEAAIDAPIAYGIAALPAELF
jgi:hypothetical protein